MYCTLLACWNVPSYRHYTEFNFTHIIILNCYMWLLTKKQELQRGLSTLYTCSQSPQILTDKTIFSIKNLCNFTSI